MSRLSIAPFRLDVELLKRINSFHTPILDRIMVFIANISEFGIIWLITGALIYLSNRKEGKTVFWQIAIAMLIGAVMNEILRLIFFRERPYLALPFIHHAGLNWTNSSFASGHTISSIAASMILIKYNKKLATYCLLLTVVIIWSRLYLGMHYPSDIIVGIIIGLIGGVITLKIFASKKVKKWLS